MINYEFIIRRITIYKHCKQFISYITNPCKKDSLELKRISEKKAQHHQIIYIKSYAN